MSLLPQWYTRLPSLLGKKKEDWANWLEEFGENFPTFANYPTGLTVSADEQNVYVEADVPGLKANQVEVSVDNMGVLWIKGERKEEKEDKEKKYYRRSQQLFSYCVPLGDDVDLSIEPKAICKNGVMRVTFIKKVGKQVEAKKIKVKEEE
jgi:HSP20 family protein